MTDLDRGAEIARLTKDQRQNDTASTSRRGRERIGGDFTLSFERLIDEDPDTAEGEIGQTSSQKAEQLKAAIDELPEVLRDTINALFYERLTEADAASRFGVSRALVRKRRDQAFAALRQVLAPEQHQAAS